MESRSSVAMSVVTLLVLRSVLSSATLYTVGDSAGWATGIDYSAWVAGKVFVVGDVLAFNYAPGVHTVDKVKAKAYKACSVSNSIATDSSGSTTMRLNKTGNHYFICGVLDHCSTGMKLAIKAAASSSTAAAPVSSTPSTSSNATTIATPSSNSSSNTFPAITSPSTTASTAVNGHCYTVKTRAVIPLTIAAFVSLIMIGLV